MQLIIVVFSISCLKHVVQGLNVLAKSVFGLVLSELDVKTEKLTQMQRLLVIFSGII